MAKVEVKTEYPGIVPVRAIENREGLLRENSPCGFFGVKRYPGDVFHLNKPEEFSARWMELVEPEALPEGWLEVIQQREKIRAARMNELSELEKKSDAAVQAEVVQLAIKQTILTLAGAQSADGKAIPSHEFNYSTGKKRGRPPKLGLHDASVD